MVRIFDRILALLARLYHSWYGRLLKPKGRFLPIIPVSVAAVDIAGVPKQNEPTILRDHTITELEQKNETIDSDYQTLWTNVMEEGSYKKSSLYENVAVLNLYWSKDSSDMDTKKEVDEVEEVFKELFSYTVVTKCLVEKGGQRVQVQVNDIVAQFVRAYDNTSVPTLLIVYYAGHGRPGYVYGDLELRGQVIPKSRQHCANLITEDPARKTPRRWTSWSGMTLKGF